MLEPLVMIPGLMADARIFAPQLDALSPLMPVMVALPIGGRTVEEISATLLPKLPERCAVLGQGLGGDVALDLFRRAPKRISRLVLIGADPLAETPQGAATRELRRVGVKAGRLLDVMAEDYPDAALAPGDGRPAIRGLLRSMAENLGEAVYLAQSEALARRPDQQKTLRKVPVPALILTGAHDSLVPMRRLEFMAEMMPFAELQVIAGAGHFPSIETPQAINAALRGFLPGPMLLR